MGNLFDDYALDGFFDECQSEGQPHPHYERLFRRLSELRRPDERIRLADISPSTRASPSPSTAQEGIERIFPFDPVPRIIPQGEWQY